MKTITIIYLLLVSSYGWSCDNCNVYLNVTPNDNKHSIGFFFRNRLMMGEYSMIGQQIMTKHASHGNDPAFLGNQVKEQYRTYELRATLMLGKRFRTYIMLPFVQHLQFIDVNKRFDLSGIGDPIVIQSFQINDPLKVSKHENFRQRFEIGIGIKAPLGKTDKLVNNIRLNLDLQPGSGSWDFIGMMKYIFTIDKFGCMFNSTYKINGKTVENYKYGKAFNSTLNVFYQTKLKFFTFMPMIGAGFENAAVDESNVQHTDTGGTSVFAQLGVQVFYKKFQLFGEFQKAVSNKLNGYTQLINKHRINLGLIYNI